MAPHHSSAFHPQTDGQSECTNQTLEQYLCHYVNYSQDNWVSLLPLAEFAYNNAQNSATGVSPFYATYGYHPAVDDLPLPHPSPAETPAATEWVATIHATLEHLRAHLVRAQQAAKHQADKHHQQAPFQVGDLVWIQTHNLQSHRPARKLDYRKIGPFPITEAINPVAFRVKLPPSLHIHDVFHASLLCPHVANRVPGQMASPPPPVHYVGQEEAEYEVEAVLDIRK